MKTLEELLKALNEAKEKSEAAPTDKALATEFAEAQAAYDEAKAEADRTEQDPPVTTEDFDESKADEKTKKYIKKLRDEAAKTRLKAKDLASKAKISEDQKKAILTALGIESEEDPKEKLKKFESENQTNSFRLAVLESALEHGVPRDQVDFYEFLITKATEALEEGEELSDESLTEILARVKASGGKGAANSTAANKGGKKTPPPEGNTSGITLEKFCAMSMAEKSKLYETNQALYLELMQQAKTKRKLVS